jgi:isopentenyldiphosphate isomerase
MEYWDLYDENKNKLNKTVKRGDYLEDNEYHLVVNVWIKNKNNQFLISQRNEHKSHPLMWETTGGSVLKGETTLDGALREAKEELNVDLNKKDGKLIGSGTRYYKGCPDILDVYLFEIDDSNLNIKIQEEEVKDYKWATYEEIMEIYNNNQFEATLFFEEALNYIKNVINQYTHHLYLETVSEKKGL